MNIKKVILIFLGLACGAFSFAQDAVPPEAPRPDAPKVDAKKLPPSADASAASAKDMILFRFDKDKDGFLNKEEMAEAKQFIEERQKRIEQMQLRMAEAAIKDFDKDKDGKLNAEELISLLEKHRKIFAEIRAQNPNMNLPEGLRPSDIRQRLEGRPESVRPDGGGMRLEGPQGPQGPRPDGVRPDSRPRTPVSLDDLKGLEKPAAPVADEKPVAPATDEKPAE